MLVFIRNADGFTLVEIAYVTKILQSIPKEEYTSAMKKARALECAHNLKQIYQTLMMYELQNGKLPNAKFFPKNVNDRDSIEKILGLPQALSAARHCL